jgi:riboflavin kinase/FMN adenylyltransferase
VRVIRGLPSSSDGPVALTIGNFDGVHRGHQAMLSRLTEAAEDLALPSVVLTFDPPPREFFASESAPPRVSTLRGKLECLTRFGVTRTVIARFDQRLACLSPDEFIADVLVRRLDARWVLVGEDFRFGKGRAGDIATLRAAAKTFTIEAMRTVSVDNERASSTAIRHAHSCGDLKRAAAMLGRPFTMAGRVAHGAALGRTLGFPTANIRLRRMPPVCGIFAVHVHGIAKTPLPGVASVGIRPTITDSGEPVLEVFILDFDEAIYGRRLAVEFLHKLRDEERLPNLEALARRIRADVGDARAFFARTDSALELAAR